MCLGGSILLGQGKPTPTNPLKVKNENIYDDVTYLQGNEKIGKHKMFTRKLRIYTLRSNFLLIHASKRSITV